MWWHVACVVFESKKRGRGHVKQCFPAGLLDSAAINCMQSSMAQVLRITPTSTFLSAIFLNRLHIVHAEPSPHGKLPEKKKSRKSVLTAVGTSQRRR
jgi:hypothetical protein